MEYNLIETKTGDIWKAFSLPLMLGVEFRDEEYRRTELSLPLNMVADIGTRADLFTGLTDVPSSGLRHMVSIFENTKGYTLFLEMMARLLPHIGTANAKGFQGKNIYTGTL